MGNLKEKKPKHIFKYKKPSTLIKIIRKNKNPQEREKESIYNFFCGENMDWMEEMISNLYKIKWGEEESKYNIEKMMKEVWQ